MDYLTKQFQWINQMFEKIQPPTVANSKGEKPYIKDSRIRFIIDTVSFHVDLDSAVESTQIRRPDETIEVTFTVTPLPRETDKRNTDSEIHVKTNQNQTKTKENNTKTRETQGP